MSEGMISDRGEGAGLAGSDESTNVMKAAPVVPPEVNPSRQQVVEWRGLAWLTWFRNVVTITTVKHGGVLGHSQFDMGNSGERVTGIENSPENLED